MLQQVAIQLIQFKDGAGNLGAGNLGAGKNKDSKIWGDNPHFLLERCL